MPGTVTAERGGSLVLDEFEHDETLGSPCLTCRLSPRRSRARLGRLGHTPLEPGRAGEDATRRLAGSKPFRGSGEGCRRVGKKIEKETRRNVQ